MKATVTDLNEIPEPLRAEYEERDGKYVLKLEGDVPGMASAETLADANSRIKEFRMTNIDLRTKLEDLEARYKEYDPAAVAAMREKLAKLDKEGGADDLLTQVQELRSIVQGHDKERKEHATALARKDLESMLTREGLSAGVEPAAMPDYISRGLSAFVLKEGSAVAMDNGRPVYSERNGEPMGVGEWVAGLATSAPHLFRRSNGGGATGDGDSKNSGVKTWDGSDEQLLEYIDEIAAGTRVLEE